jgi:hypothetical protein
MIFKTPPYCGLSAVADDATTTKANVNANITNRTPHRFFKHFFFMISLLFKVKINNDGVLPGPWTEYRGEALKTLYSKHGWSDFDP